MAFGHEACRVSESIDLILDRSSPGPWLALWMELASKHPMGLTVGLINLAEPLHLCLEPDSPYEIEGAIRTASHTCHLSDASSPVASDVHGRGTQNILAAIRKHPSDAALYVLIEAASGNM